jgi:hypothetical protein
MDTSVRNSISNPERILRLLDQKLSSPMELTIYGRAALALGFDHPRDEFFSTNDVDAVIPVDSAESFRQNEDFWVAQEAVNKELESEGLYMTHIFTDADVILCPGWAGQRVPIAMSFQNLRVFRPSTLDLILTKMMRDDPIDLADIEFLFLQEPSMALQIPSVFDQAKIPEIPEIVEQFESMKPKVVQIAERFVPRNNL